jgi:hypothetical protein
VVKRRPAAASAAAVAAVCLVALPTSALRAASPPRLAAAPPVVVELCRALKRDLRAAGSSWPVECPPRVPAGGVDNAELSGLFSQSGFGPGYIINLFSPSLRGSQVSGGHWTVAAGSMIYMRRWIRRSATGSIAGKLTPSTQTMIGGVRVRRYVVPSGGDALYSGHVIFEWRRGKADVMLSVHDPRNETVGRELVAALLRA